MHEIAWTLYNVQHAGCTTAVACVSCSNPSTCLSSFVLVQSKTPEALYQLMLSTLLLHRRIWGGKEVFFCFKPPAVHRSWSPKASGNIVTLCHLCQLHSDDSELWFCLPRLPCLRRQQHANRSHGLRGSPLAIPPWPSVGVGEWPCSQEWAELNQGIERQGEDNVLFSQRS